MSKDARLRLGWARQASQRCDGVGRYVARHRRDRGSPPTDTVRPRGLDLLLGREVDILAEQ